MYTTQGSNGLYLHNTSLANGAGDNSYRYAGPSDEVNNYVCFGSPETPCPNDNLYRIIGVFGSQVKLIKYDYATYNLLGTTGAYSSSYTGSGNSGTNNGSNALSSIGTYYWNVAETNIWGESNLFNNNLNQIFINNIGNNWANKIAESTWKSGGNTYNKVTGESAPNIYQDEIISPVGGVSVDAKIVLMYISDYTFASSSDNWNTIFSNYYLSEVSSDNWMYMGLLEWTITRVSDSSNRAFYISFTSYDYHSTYVKTSFALRPCFYLNADVSYNGGEGTSSSPYKIL